MNQKKHTFFLVVCLIGANANMHAAQLLRSLTGPAVRNSVLAACATVWALRNSQTGYLGQSVMVASTMYGATSEVQALNKKQEEDKNKTTQRTFLGLNRDRQNAIKNLRDITVGSSAPLSSSNFKNAVDTFAPPAGPVVAAPVVAAPVARGFNRAYAGYLGAVAYYQVQHAYGRAQDLYGWLGGPSRNTLKAGGFGAGKGAGAGAILVGGGSVLLKKLDEAKQEDAEKNKQTQSKQ